MKLTFEISKEHQTLPAAEIISCLKAENIKYQTIEINQDALIIETQAQIEDIRKIADRLSFTYNISEQLFSCKPQIPDIKQKANNIPIKIKGTIAVKYKNRSTFINSQDIVKTLAEVYTENRKVVLKNPDIEIRALITDSKVYTGLKVAHIDRRQYEKRKVQNRPFFLPISLHPKLARALVNLTSVKRGEILVDPFCGTGGILIEAGLIGVRIIGSDVEEKMIQGCKANLDHYDIKNYELFQADIGKIDQHIKTADAIATDFPYGKSTTTKGEIMEKLYERAFSSISKILKNKKKAVIGLSEKKFLKIGENQLKLEGIQEIRVHGSLTRYFGIYKK